MAKLRLDALRQADAQSLAAEEIDEPKQEEAEEPVEVAIAVEQVDQDSDTPQWSTGEEIRAAFVDTGKGLRGPGTGGWWTERYRLNGEIVGRIAGRVYSGTWSIDGDVICFNYVTSTGLRRSLRRDWCGHLAISGDTILQWNEDGEKQQVKIGVID